LMEPEGDMRKLAFVLVAFVTGCGGGGGGSTQVGTSSTPPSGGSDGGVGMPTPDGGGTTPGGGGGAGDGGSSGAGGGSGGGGTPLGWTSVANPGGDYNAVWAAAPDDVWFGPPMTHWTLGTFTRYPDVDTVEQLSGTGSSDVYAHVLTTHLVGGEPRPWGSVFHWNGVGWTNQSETPPPLSLYARTPTDVYVNGGGPLWRSTDQGVTWSDVPVPDPCGGSDFVAGSDLDVVAIGSSCTADDAYLRWSRDGGATWGIGHAPLDGMRALGVRSGSAYISGYAFLANGNATELLLRTDDGVSFRSLAPGITVTTIWVDSPDEVWIASYGTGLRHSTDGGQTWTVERPETINAVYAVGAHDLFAVGLNGTLLHLSR
jgi:hypothetical protein